MRSYKKMMSIAVVALAVTLFQNCSKTEFQKEASTSSSVSQFDQEQGNISINQQQGNTSNSVALISGNQASTCLSSGEVFTTGSGDPTTGYAQPFIYYRKCDGEIEKWRSMGEKQCCSHKVSIVDNATYSDSQCSDGRFQGVMTCL